MFKPKELNKLLKETCKLFCLGYIKPFLYICIKTFDDEKFKFEDESRKKIIDVINGDNSIYSQLIINFEILIKKFIKNLQKNKINHQKIYQIIKQKLEYLMIIAKVKLTFNK